MANTFDPSKKQASVTLSNGNLTATGTLATNWETALCVDGYSSGKWYFELTFDVEIYKGGGGAYDFAFGVANLSHNLSNFIGVDANGWSLLDPNSVGYFAGVNTAVDFGGATDIEVNDVVGIALDMDNGKIWWSLNGLWGDSGDPATDTNPQATGLTGTLYPGVSVYGNGSQVTINFGSTDLAYTPPAGFKAPDIPTSFTSVQDGEWDDPETWGYPASASAFYPARDGDTVYIAASDTVTYSISADGQMGQIDVYGTLTFAPSADTKLVTNYNNGYIIVRQNTGILNVGTSATPIHKDYTCKIVTVGTAHAAHGFSIQDNSDFNIYGDSDYYGGLSYTRLASSGDDTDIIEVVDDASGWNIGDEIVIHKNDTHTDNEWYQQNLLTTIVGVSGTTIQCADSVSTDFNINGLVQHLTRNVKVYREGYPKELGSDPSSVTPAAYQLSTSVTYTSRFRIKHAEFGGMYRGNSLPDDTIIDGIVVRYCYYPFINSGGIYVENSNFVNLFYFVYEVQGSYFKNCTITCMKNNLNQYSSNNTYEDCIIKDLEQIASSGIRWCRFIRTEFTCSFGVIQGSQMKFIDCAFAGCIWPTYAPYCFDVVYHNCKVGYDLDGNLVPTAIGIYVAYGDMHLYNCLFDDDSISLYQNDNDYYCRINIQNHQQIEGNDFVIFNRAYMYVVDADGTDSNPTQRINGESRIYRFEPLSACNKVRKDAIVEHKYYVSSATSKTFRYYLQTDFTAGLDNEEVILEVTYPVSGSIDISKSTNTIAIRADQDDWSQYVEVSVSPETDGWIEMRLYLGAYEAGKYVWIDPKPEIS